MTDSSCRPVENGSTVQGFRPRLFHNKPAITLLIRTVVFQLAFSVQGLPFEEFNFFSLKSLGLSYYGTKRKVFAKTHSRMFDRQSSTTFSL